MPPVYYPAVIDRSASGFGVSFPDFPGCIAAGDTVQAAAVNAEAALALHLDGMRADKDAVPSPSSLDDIEQVDGADDVAKVLVRADMPGSFTRIQVTIEDSVLAAIDAVAPNRSSFLTDAARDRLESQARLAVNRVKARQVYVIETKGKEWRVSPHWSEDLPSGRVAAASTVLPDKFDTAEDAFAFAARTYDIPEKKVIVRPAA